MVTGIFQYYTLAEVVAIHTGTKTPLTGKSSVVEYSIGGRTIRKEFPFPLDRLLEEINWALNFLDPVAYPSPFTDRTLAKFN